MTTTAPQAMIKILAIVADKISSLGGGPERMLSFPDRSIKPRVGAIGVENAHDLAALVVPSRQELRRSIGVGVRHFSYGEGEPWK
jgi:hypothetical protein